MRRNLVLLFAFGRSPLFDRFGNPMFPLMLYSWERTITDFDLIAGLISVSQMLAASALHLSWEARKRQWGICGLSLVALGSLVSFETGAAVDRAFKIDQTAPQVVSAALAPGGAALPLGSASTPLNSLTALSLDVVDPANPSVGRPSPA